jgi:hypothetical protein
MMYRRLWNRSVLNSYSSAILRSGQRFVVRADGKLTAFVELESAVHCARQTVNSGQLLSQKAKRTNANTEKHHGASAVWHVDGQVIEGNLCAVHEMKSLSRTIKISDAKKERLNICHCPDAAYALFAKRRKS